jgi:hypothetical protein
LRSRAKSGAQRLILPARTFGKQVDEFQELFTPMPGPRIVDWHSNDTLFLAFFGINDMVRNVWKLFSLVSCLEASD